MLNTRSLLVVVLALSACGVVLSADTPMLRTPCPEWQDLAPDQQQRVPIPEYCLIVDEESPVGVDSASSTVVALLPGVPDSLFRLIAGLLAQL